MLTIKHVDSTRKERVVSVQSVEFFPGEGVLVGHGSPEGTVTFNTGHAFVTNENGKTVAVYNMQIPLQKEKEKQNGK